jgi:hypothetical protein
LRENLKVAETAFQENGEQRFPQTGTKCKIGSPSLTTKSVGSSSRFIDAIVWARPSRGEDCVLDFANALAEHPVVFGWSRKTLGNVGFATCDAEVCIFGN